MQFAESAEHWGNPLQARLESSSRRFLCVVHLGVHVGRCWQEEAGWQKAEQLADAQVLEEISLGRESLAHIYEKLSEHVGRVQILLE
jgi:hypothetical protein